jgi:multiple RNA-binding domain-containing protein 1
VDEADPKLKEFLEVMQPASKSKNWASQAVEDHTSEPPRKIQAMEVSGAESDEEYETVPKKHRQKSPPKHDVPSMAAPVGPSEPPIHDEEVVVPSIAPDATDDDWLRGRTNRLLDLIDPADIPTATTRADNAVVEVAAEEPEVEEVPVVEENEDEEEEKPDPIVEAIQSNGRLFVRNLPYTATEDDLRQHFEPFGALEEVGTLSPLFFPALS